MVFSQSITQTASISKAENMMEAFVRDMEGVRSEAEVYQILQELMEDPDMIDSCNAVEKQWKETHAKFLKDIEGKTQMQMDRIFEESGFLELLELWNFCQLVYNKQIEMKKEQERQEELVNLADEIKIPLEDCMVLRDRADKFFRDYFAKLDEGKGVPDEWVPAHPDSQAKDMFFNVHRCDEYYPVIFNATNAAIIKTFR